MSSSAPCATPAEENNVIYLNNAGQAWLDPTVQALGREQVSKPPFAMSGVEDEKKIRQFFATLIGSDSNHIAIMPSTAFATTFVARNVERLITPKKKILVLQDQFTSAVYPWQELCEDSLLELLVVPNPCSSDNAYTNWTEANLDHLTHDVMVACLPPLFWADGALLDLRAIGAKCHQLDIFYVVDATQAVGILPCTLETCGNPHVLAASVHKWLRGPPGASLVYVKPELHATWKPLDQSTYSRAPGGSSMGPNGYACAYHPDARKFDAGGRPNPILLPMLRLGMQQVVERVDLDTAQDQMKRLMQPLLDWASRNGFELPKGPHCYHLVGLRPTFLTPTQMLEVLEKLRAQNVHLMIRCGGFRVSPYLDTTPQQIQRFIQILEEVCKPYRK